MIAAIANGGYLITPHVTLRLEWPLANGRRAMIDDRHLQLLNWLRLTHPISAFFDPCDDDDTFAKDADRGR